MIKIYGFIYITTNLINNKKYIGKCEYQRINNWENYLGSGKILKQAIKKYGKENFIKDIIYNAETLEDLNIAEIYYIELYNACENKEFYNIASGGTGGNTRLGYTEEQYKEYCQKFSKPGNQNPMYGKTHTEESKIKNGNKTKERFKDNSFRKRHSEAVKEAMQNVDKSKLSLENRKRKKKIKCAICGKEELVYTSQQKFCSECKSKYTSWQLSCMIKNMSENIC